MSNMKRHPTPPQFQTSTYQQTPLKYSPQICRLDDLRKEEHIFECFFFVAFARPDLWSIIMVENKSVLISYRTSAFTAGYKELAVGMLNRRNRQPWLVRKTI